jgi:hypothetical protein
MKKAPRRFTFLSSGFSTIAVLEMLDDKHLTFIFQLTMSNIKIYGIIKGKM